MSEPGHSQTRILVVDDESIVVSLVRDALEEEGYAIECASSASEALAVLQAKEIDLVVTDIRMPGMNGIEMVKKARAYRPDMGVIFMTGYANLNSAKDAIKQGAFDYILKPFELDEIRRAVKSAIQKLKKESEEKSPTQQIDRLSDLNQMLVSVGDRSTLSTVSLRFAMMHCQSDIGAVIFWDKARTAFNMITIVDNNTKEETLPREQLSACLSKMDLSGFKEPVLVTRREDYPLCCPDSDPGTSQCFLPKWFTEGIQMIAVPIRANSLLGLFMVGFQDDSPAVKETDLKLLSIIASQLALSLENLELLEETQQAYSRLRELQDETIQLEKMATRGEMSAEIGHELNNFLGVVAGNLSMLEFHLQKENYAELDKYIQATFENIEKIKKFTGNLMELTHISSEKRIIRFDQLLQEVIDYLKPQRRFRGVTINVEPINEPILFEADSIHIQQLLYNLFNNAADATVDCPKREITVRCEVNAADGTFRFGISDTGVGIEPDLQEKLFNERFTTKPHGHGFGLVVCRRIVDNHGGKIHFESTPGQGTTIYIDFPLAVEAPTEATVS
jgi:signal transduction histidine kinase/CheY-like chemotaxis protein